VWLSADCVFSASVAARRREGREIRGVDVWAAEVVARVVEARVRGERGRGSMFALVGEDVCSQG